MAEDVAGGPGWVIRSLDLQPVITDIDSFRLGMRGDPLAEVIELLWTGRPAEALEILASARLSLRVRALRADCFRDLGDTVRAVAQYDGLVAETLGTPDEAVMRQHRGKALLAAGHVQSALEDFGRAVELRQNGDSALFASAVQAFEAARNR